MDNTNLFKANVKTVKLRCGPDLHQPQTENILKKRLGCQTSSKAKEILRYITKLRDFLLDSRKDYINMRHLTSDACSMTDYERDKIDTEAEAVIHQCNTLIKDLNNEVKKAPFISKQLVQHQEAILDLIKSYLKAVSSIYTGQRAIRVKRAVDMKKMSRLESLVRSSKAVRERNLQGYLRLETEDDSKAADVTDPQGSSEVEIDRLDLGVRNRFRRTSVNQTLPIESVSTISDSKSNIKDMYQANQIHPTNIDYLEATAIFDELTPDQRQQLQKENDQLYQEMNSLVDEVQQIEGKVMEIAKLQEVFTEKVLSQDVDIQRIHTTAVHTTDNIKTGNEEIREAMRKKAGFRVWVMFFLIVMSFTLLFLDWYNP